MPAHYVNVTIGEMDAFLRGRGFAPILLPGTQEQVYAKRVDRDGMTLSLRIYTGINPDGNSRQAGRDAIRVMIFWKKPNPEATEQTPPADRFRVVPVGGSRRVHRTQGWRDNLGERLDSWETHLGPKCPRCGSPMVEREGRNGPFWGCTDWPACRGTLSKANPRTHTPGVHPGSDHDRTSANPRHPTGQGHPCR